MPNAYFEPGERRAAKVEALFTRIARRYDLINDLQSFGLHRRWKRRVVELSQAGAGLLALDVCCGTGDLALGLAQAGCEVAGLDFTKEMLEVATERKAKSERLRVPTFIRGDAQFLPFPAHTFDIVTVGYGLRNLADWEIGLREMARVAKPGGRLLVLEFGKPQNPIWRAIYFSYLKLFVPCLGLFFCGSASAYSYILSSLKHYPAQEGVRDKMREMGLTNVRVISFLGGVMSVNYGERGA